MPGEDRQSSQVEAARTSLQLAFKVLAQVGGLTLIVVVGALFGGLALDRAVGTKPLFTVLLLVGSFPVSLYIIYRVALGAVAPLDRGRPGQAAPRTKEDPSSGDNP